MGNGRGRDLADLAWTDLDRPPILLVPVGSCEQHGPHLPIGTDTLIATAIARDVAARHPGRVVAPALAITASGEHQGFPGTLSIGTEVMTNVLVELVRSAGWAEQVVFVNGHGGNVSALTAAAATLEYESRPAIVWSPDVRPLVSAGVVSANDLHAGHIETSIMFSLNPELVRADRAAPGPSPAPPFAVLARDGVRAVSANGVLGDPTTASAEAGRQLFAAFTDQLAARLDALAR